MVTVCVTYVSIKPKVDHVPQTGRGGKQTKRKVTQEAPAVEFIAAHFFGERRNTIARN